MKRLVSWIGFTIGFTFILAIVGTAAWRLASPLLSDRTVDEPLPFALPLPILATATPQFPTDEEVGVILPPTVTVTIPLTITGPITGPITATVTVTATEVVTATPTFTSTEVTSTEVTSTEVTSTEVTSTEVTSTEVTSTEVTSTEVTGTEVITTTPPSPEPIRAFSSDTEANTASVLGQGTFVDGDAIHKGSGLATLYHAPDGSYLLRFDDFTTTNGPDVHVLLSPNAAPADHDSLGEYLDLGEIKGNIGDQNYALPADFDPSLYKSVVIHCLAFKVIFATATLE